MADYGNGPYAWIRELGSPERSIGPCLADAICGFPEEFGVSKELETQFAEWVTEFERDWKEHNIADWEKWNQRGIALSKKLKREFGDKFLVKYHYPHEDPRFDGDPPRVEITD